MSRRADATRGVAASRSDPEEVELKLTVLDAVAIRTLVMDPPTGLPGVTPLGPPRMVDLEDQYLDTADGALRAAGLVARIRTSPGGRRLTLKSLVRRGAGAVHRRLELEGDAGDGDDPRPWPPSVARDQLLETVGASPLVPLTTLRQRRLQRDVAVGASVVELSLDEVEVATSDNSANRWVELEAELRSGSEADLAALGAALAGRPDLERAARSKLQRALRLDRTLDPSPTRILVLCTGNSCRSQMAEAFLARAGGSRVVVSSGGTRPSTVHPMTTRVLAERGIDWSAARSKSMNEFLNRAFDVVVTVCDDAREACPVFPGGGRRVHEAFRDPALATGMEAERLAAYRGVRDEIERWAEAFVSAL